MNKCSICGKELGFWNSYAHGEDYYCEVCWQIREDKIETSREDEERNRPGVNKLKSDNEDSI